MISFSFCDKKNIKKLMKFLSENWQKNYILSKDLKFINWQHYSREKKRYNFAIVTLDTKIIGCLGFINHSNFSNKLISDDTLWLVNWVVIKKAPVSGLELISFLVKKLNYNRVGSVGCNSRAIAIFKELGFKIGELNHYFALNPNISNFSLINAPKNLLNSLKSSSKNIQSKKLKLVNTKFQLDVFGKDINKLVKKFGKDETYFINRYICHPYYKYKIYWIYSSNNSLGFIVTRICKFQDKKALRIVDFFGHDKALIGINIPLQQLLIKISAEYVDFYEYAIDDSVMSRSGLRKNDFDDKIVVPNYFEPFVKKNINLRWAIKSNNSTISPIFKGDCDQDRPNKIQE